MSYTASLNKSGSQHGQGRTDAITIVFFIIFTIN